MLAAEVGDQQRGGPHRRAIPELAGVSVNNFGDQGINDALSRARTTTARRISQAQVQGNVVALLDSDSPVVNALTGDAQTWSNLANRLAFIKPD
jgi:hypothetical protein